MPTWQLSRASLTVGCQIAVYYESTTSSSKIGSAHIRLSNVIPGWKAFLIMLSGEIPLSKRFLLG